MDQAVDEENQYEKWRPYNAEQERGASASGAEHCAARLHRIGRGPGRPVGSRLEYDRVHHRGLFEVANEPSQLTLSLVISLVRQPAQFLDVATVHGKLSQPTRGLLVTVVCQPAQLLEVATLHSKLSQPSLGLLVSVIRQPTQLLDVATLHSQLSQPSLGLLVSVIRQPTQLLDVATLQGKLSQPSLGLLITVICKLAQHREIRGLPVRDVVRCWYSARIRHVDLFSACVRA
jgi:hypothetical protein